MLFQISLMTNLMVMRMHNYKLKEHKSILGYNYFAVTLSFLFTVNNYFEISCMLQISEYRTSTNESIYFKRLVNLEMARGSLLDFARSDLHRT